MPLAGLGIEHLSLIRFQWMMILSRSLEVQCTDGLANSDGSEDSS